MCAFIQSYQRNLCASEILQPHVNKLLVWPNDNKFLGSPDKIGIWSIRRRSEVREIASQIVIDFTKYDAFEMVYLRKSFLVSAGKLHPKLWLIWDLTKWPFYFSVMMMNIAIHSKASLLAPLQTKWHPKYCEISAGWWYIHWRNTFHERNILPERYVWYSLHKHDQIFDEISFLFLRLQFLELIWRKRIPHFIYP